MVTEWISCKQRLPEDGQIVLVTGRTGEINLARRDKRYFDFGENITTSVGPVTHWMPLPDAPEVDE